MSESLEEFYTNVLGMTDPWEVASKAGRKSSRFIKYDSQNQDHCTHQCCYSRFRRHIVALPPVVAQMSLEGPMTKAEAGLLFYYSFSRFYRFCTVGWSPFRHNWQIKSTSVDLGHLYRGWVWPCSGPP